MYIDVPRQICAIDGALAKVEVHDTQCDVDLALTDAVDGQSQPRLGQWVPTHVGFVMSVINEAEACDTLEALQNMLDVELDVDALLYGEE